MNLFAPYFSTAMGVVGQTERAWSPPRGSGASSALLDASKERVTSVIDTFRGVVVIALLLLIRVQDIRAQAVPSASSPDVAPSPPSSDWTGVYIGAHAGVSSGGTAWSATQPGAPTLSGSLTPFHPYNVFDGSGSQFGGLVAGYNFRASPRIIIGQA